MVQRVCQGLSVAERTELWDRWQRGDSLKALGRTFSKPSLSIYFQPAPQRGIRSAPWRRSCAVLTVSERKEILRGIVVQRPICSIALLLDRSSSTVSRKVRRNGGYDRYRTVKADEQAWAAPIVRSDVSWQHIHPYVARWRGNSNCTGLPSRSLIGAHVRRVVPGHDAGKGGDGQPLKSWAFRFRAMGCSSRDRAKRGHMRSY